MRSTTGNSLLVNNSITQAYDKFVFHSRGVCGQFVFRDTSQRSPKRERESTVCYVLVAVRQSSSSNHNMGWSILSFFFHQIIFFYPYLNYFTKAPKHFIFLNNQQNFGTGNYIFTGDLIIYGGKKIDELKESLRMDIYLLESPACSFKMETNFIRVFLYIFFKNGRHDSVAPMLPFHVDVGSTITHPQSGFITKRCYGFKFLFLSNGWSRLMQVQH